MATTQTFMYAPTGQAVLTSRPPWRMAASPMALANALWSFAKAELFSGS